jgi:hypothetical protein
MKGEKMSEEKIMTLHPEEGKKGVNISLKKYEQIKRAMLTALEVENEIPFKMLAHATEAQLTEPFDGSMGWYTTSIKLDLEARGILERVPNQSPQIVRLRSES